MDSAAGGMKEARNNETQAILPVRGKILNVIKASLDKALANAEINSMIQAFGLDFDLKTKKVIFDESKLRYDKIIIASDADVDGNHIQSLFYTFIWTFIPDLIRTGHIYVSVPPLYKVTIKGNKYIYLKDDNALSEYKVNNSDSVREVNRLKGLGEMDATELEKTMLQPDNRIINKIIMQSEPNTALLFEQLMGDSAAARKTYIEKHAKEIEVFV